MTCATIKNPPVNTRLNHLSYFVVYIFQYLYINFYPLVLTEVEANIQPIS